MILVKFWMIFRLMMNQTLICLVLLMVKTKKNEKEKENDEEIFFNDVKMESYGTKDDLETQIDVNPDYLMSFDLNNVGNIDIGIIVTLIIF
jgi:hypothetical protein